MEIWKDCKHYEGLYQISDRGRVWNVKFQRYVKPFKTNSGYLCVHLFNKSGKRVNELVHRLVALTFIPNPYNKPQVNHKNEFEKENNCVDNLMWVTDKENKNWGTFKERMAKSKSKPIVQLSLSGEFIREWIGGSAVEKETGFFSSAINACCNGKLKTAYGYIWKFKEDYNNLKGGNDL